MPVDQVPWRVCLSTVQGRLPADKQPFDGWPYLLTRIGGTPLRHLLLLPSEWTRGRLLHVARRQAAVNWLPTCLVTGASEALYFSPQGVSEESDKLPSGVIVTGLLAPAEPAPESDELSARRAALAAYRDSHRAKGHLMGDGFEGARVATHGDVDRYLAGPPDGVPKGLTTCTVCGERAGEYLAMRGEASPDGEAGSRYHMVPVYCRCENRNRCAACGDPLGEHRLGAYYYDEAAGRVRYYPAYRGLRHDCKKKEKGT